MLRAIHLKTRRRRGNVERARLRVVIAVARIAWSGEP